MADGCISSSKRFSSPLYGKIAGGGYGSALDGAASVYQRGHDLVSEGVHLLLFFFPCKTGTAEHHAAREVVVAADFLDAQDAFDHLLDVSAQTRADCRWAGGWRWSGSGRGSRGRMKAAQVAPQVLTRQLEFLG